MELLSSWRHTGFSVHNSVYVPPSDQQAVEALVRYMMRPPVSLARLRLLPAGDQVLHFPKAGGDDPGSPQPERIDAMDYVARALAQIPPPRKDLVRYHGYYSNAARGRRRKRDRDGLDDAEAQERPALPPASAATRKRWADLLRRVYEIDPLVCPRCAASMKVVGFITKPATIKHVSEMAIYLHLASDQVRFCDDAGHPMRLEEVPPLVFSEVMRDVDLFISVCSIATDPTWHDQGEAPYRDYWVREAFGELSASARERRAVLETILPASASRRAPRGQSASKRRASQ